MKIRRLIQAVRKHFAHPEWDDYFHGVSSLDYDKYAVPENLPVLVRLVTRGPGMPSNSLGHALSGLGHLHDPATFRPLLKALFRPDISPLDRSSIAVTLAKIGGPSALEHVLGASRKYPECDFTVAVGCTRSPEAIAPLVEILKQGSGSSASANYRAGHAAFGLADIGGAMAREALMMFITKEPLGASDAVRALSEIAHADDQEVVDLLIRTMLATWGKGWSELVRSMGGGEDYHFSPSKTGSCCALALKTVCDGTSFRKLRDAMLSATNMSLKETIQDIINAIEARTSEAKA